ncbi:MAG: hypothetical protein A3K83_02070, partial [Omnitrophica WOR_2 bacterium RBG_13_44_8b]
MRKLCIFLLFLSFASLGFTQNLPQPQGWVNDFAQVVSQEYKEKLTALIEELEQKTSCEIAVVTIDSIAPYDENAYARLLFDNWKPGKKGKDNGVLVLLAVRQRRWRIETGYGIEGVLPDGLCGEIGRNYMVPYFKDAKFSEGLYKGVAAIARVISQNENTVISGLEGVKLEQATDNKVEPLFYIFAPLFFFIWNLPWPFIIGLPFTLIFAIAFFAFSPLLGILVIIGYLASLIVRYRYWNKLPPEKRKSFFGPQ